MPIVIDEVVISVEVREEPSTAGQQGALPADERQAIVAECVERVLEILKRREEP
jgi:hypothetical protein